MTTEDRPVLRVVRGDATAEEVAALVAVLTARSTAASAAAPTERPRRSEWSDPGRLLRPTLRPRPGAWRASALPRQG